MKNSKLMILDEQFSTEPVFVNLNDDQDVYRCEYFEAATSRNIVFLVLIYFKVFLNFILGLLQLRLH